MAYQHLNRLVSHWQPKDLTPTAKTIALYLASNIQSEGKWQGYFFHSGEKIASQLGFSLSATYEALGLLVDLGLFETKTRHRGSRLRTYSLALDCPEACPDRNHYTETEIARNGKTYGKPTLEATDPEPITEIQYIDLEPITEFQYTYKEILNKENLDIDIASRLSKVLLGVITETLKDLPDKSAKHLRLFDYLGERPELIALDALALVADKDQPEAYLRAVTIKTPEALYKTARAELGAKGTLEAKTGLEAVSGALRVYVSDAIDLEATGELEAVYNETLLTSGAIPDELLEIAKALAEFGAYPSLAHLVAECRATHYGLEADTGFSDDGQTFGISITGIRRPQKSEFGQNLEAYDKALCLHYERVDYEALFDKKHEALTNSKPEGMNLDEWFNDEAFTALEEEFWQNPELSGEPNHYARLILAEIETLPSLETFAEYLNGTDGLETIALPAFTKQFEEFWNAYPARPEGKGSKSVTASLWGYARTLASHYELMNASREAWANTETEFVKLPANWLQDLIQDTEQGFGNRATASILPAEWNSDTSASANPY